MRVRAKERGYDNVKLRDQGEEFELSGPMLSWMEPIGKGHPSHEKPAVMVKAEPPVVEPRDEAGVDEHKVQDEPISAQEPALVEPPRKKRAKRI